jgi:hypothetical protein
MPFPKDQFSARDLNEVDQKRPLCATHLLGRQKLSSDGRVRLGCASIKDCYDRLSVTLNASMIGQVSGKHRQ